MQHIVSGAAFALVVILSAAPAQAGPLIGVAIAAVAPALGSVAGILGSVISAGAIVGAPLLRRRCRP